MWPAVQFVSRRNLLLLILRSIEVVRFTLLPAQHLVERNSGLGRVITYFRRIRSPH